MHLAGDVTTVATTYGAILLGTCFGCSLTGVVFVQCVLYYKLYPGDRVWTKTLVFVVWAFDLIHTICIVVAVWQSVIDGFNKPDHMDVIPSSLALSVAVTAAVTFMVHCFFANRIRMLTKKWYIAAPLVFLAFLRLLSACVSTSELIRLKRYSLFIRPYPSWIFTTGVTLSASVEFIITSLMIVLLGSRRTGFANMNHVINSLILYTLETGSVTCLVTIASLICWLVMHHNLIFLGMHFAIAKLYANSLLATLNMRKRLRVDYVHSRERDHHGVGHSVNKSAFSALQHSRSRILSPNATQRSVQLNVNVETITVSQIDENNAHGEIEMTPTDAKTQSTFEQDGDDGAMDQGQEGRTDKKYPFLV